VDAKVLDQKTIINGGNDLLAVIDAAGEEMMPKKANNTEE
jgi:hypothetical protein